MFKRWLTYDRVGEIQTPHSYLLRININRHCAFAHVHALAGLSLNSSSLNTSWLTVVNIEIRDVCIVTLSGSTWILIYCSSLLVTLRSTVAQFIQNYVGNMNRVGDTEVWHWKSIHHSQTWKHLWIHEKYSDKIHKGQPGQIDIAYLVGSTRVLIPMGFPGWLHSLGHRYR